MAKCLDFKYQAESLEQLLHKKLDAAPLAQARALSKAYALLDAAESVVFSIPCAEQSMRRTLLSTR